MANVKFNDYSMQCKEQINDATIAWLYEASGEIKSAVVRDIGGSDNTERQLRGSWKNSVDESSGVATIGSPLESSFWNEFGTGSHALHGDGRKGWWVYVKNSSTKRANKKTYSQNQAKVVAASMRKKGLDAYATDGKEPRRSLYHAFTNLQSTLKKRLEDLLKGMG